MATYYISTAGSDANNGLGPDASHATNKPYLTLGKALASGSAVVPGDTVYMGPGNYFANNCVPIAGVTSAASPTAVRGDPKNLQSFKDGSSVLLAPAPVFMSTRTAVEGMDGTPASGGSFLNLTTNDPKGLQFYDLWMEGAVTINFDSNGSTDILFQDCRMCAYGGSCISTTSATGPIASQNWTFKGCVFISGGAAVLFWSTSTAAAAADVDVNFLFEGCLGFGVNWCTLTMGLSGGNKGGGVRLKGCTFIGSGTLITTTALQVSTVTPVNAEGCLHISGTRLFSAGTSTQIVDGGYNRSLSSPASTNVTEAGTTFRGVAASLVLPDLYKWGLMDGAFSRQWFGWGPSSVAAQYDSAWSSAVADFTRGTVRPWGAAASIGAMEKPTAVQDTGSVISVGGANSLKITGAGDRFFRLPVDAVATTVNVYTKSTSYGGTNYPTITVLAKGSLGITSDKTGTATDATEQDVATTSFTPTAKGIVEIRLSSRSTSVSSTTNFDRLRVVA